MKTANGVSFFTSNVFAAIRVLYDKADGSPESISIFIFLSLLRLETMLTSKICRISQLFYVY